MKKKYCILLSAFMCFYIANAQWSDLDFSPFASQDKGDPVEAHYSMQREWMNGQFDDYFNKRNADIERKVREAASQAQSKSGGIRIEIDNSTVRTSQSQQKSSYRQQQQVQKARRDAEHRAWLEQRRANQARAAAEAAERRRREEEARRRRYEMHRDNYLAASAQRDAATQAAIYHRSHEGYYAMKNYHPEEMNKIKSEFIPEPETKSTDISSIVSNRYVGTEAPITLTGNEHSSLDSDWDKFINKFWAENQEKDLPKVEIISEYELTKEDTTGIVGYEMVPIANGCGTEGSRISQLGAAIATEIESLVNSRGATTLLPLDVGYYLLAKKYCDLHDLEYYYGVPKEEADINLEKSGAFIKGPALRKVFKGESTEAYNAAQKERKTSEFLAKKFNVDVVPYGYKLVPIRKNKQ